MSKSPKNISDIVNNPTNQLRAILRKASDLLRLDEELKSLLPDELKDHCQVANLNQRALVFSVDNAHWLTLLRFISPELLERVKERYIHINEIRYLILPKGSNQNKEKKSASLSRQAAKIIGDYAKEMEENELKEKLQKLAEISPKETRS